MFLNPQRDGEERKAAVVSCYAELLFFLINTVSPSRGAPILASLAASPAGFPVPALGGERLPDIGL